MARLGGRRLISRNRILRWLRQAMGNALGGMITYENDYYSLKIQRSTGLITCMRPGKQIPNMVYVPLGFPLNEYFDVKRQNHYWPNYTLSKTFITQNLIDKQVETIGRTRDYFLRQGVLGFRQTLTFIEKQPYFVVDTRREFTKVVEQCRDESLCFIFARVAGVPARFGLMNQEIVLEGDVEEGASLCLVHPQGEVLALYSTPVFGVLVYMIDCKPLPQTLRWWVSPHVDEYCEFEVVWTDQDARRELVQEWSKCLVLPFETTPMSDFLKYSFHTCLSPQAIFETAVEILKDSRRG
jgi:hypothetical protein